MRRVLGGLLVVAALGIAPAAASAATARDVLNALADMLKVSAPTLAAYGPNCRPQVTAANAGTLATFIQSLLVQKNDDAGAVLNQVVAVCTSTGTLPETGRLEQADINSK